MPNGSTELVYPRCHSPQHTLHGDEQKEWELKLGMETPSTNTSKVCSNPELLDSAGQNPGGRKQVVRP